MTYEETDIPKKPSKLAVKNSANAQIDDVLHTHGTGKVMWRAAVKHKFFIVATYAVILTVLQFLPFLPSLIMSYVTK